MEKVYRKKLKQIFLFLFILLFVSCKTDEFKFDEITIAEDYGINLKIPLYIGMDKMGDKLEFADFIYDWKKRIPQLSDSITILQFSDGENREIPTSLIFSPSSIIDSLAFLIDGEYSLNNIELIFTVTNSCPFPLNTQLRFIKGNVMGPPILPPAFAEADFTKSPIEPKRTVYSITLDSLQTESFVESKRINLVSWYDKTDYINQKDTLSAHYPVEYSIVLIGTAQAKNE